MAHAPNFTEVLRVGSLAGGVNMITGRSEPIDIPTEQPYEEWLMEMIVTYGIDTPHKDIKTSWSKQQAASAIGHVEISSAEAMAGIYHVYKFTKKAQRYLDIMNKENE